MSEIIIQYLSKGICWINIQSKDWYIWSIFFLKHVIPFSLYSVGILVLRTLNTPSPVFSGINNSNLSFFYLKDIEKML